MHLRHIASVHASHSLLSANIKNQDFLVCSYRNSKAAVLRHLDAVDVALMPF